MGTSMGLFVLLWMLLTRYWTYQVSTRGLRQMELQNATLFSLLLFVSLVGVVFDVWRISTGFPAPRLGHAYHVVGLTVGLVIEKLIFLR